MKHFASPEFWRLYEALPQDVRDSADRSFEQLKQNSRHPGVHFKKVGQYWSARVGLGHRALAVQSDDGFLWFWIGTHAEYDRVIGG